jgi:outer membrane protein
MKRIISVAILLIAFVAIGKNSMAQNIKFGHINNDELIQAMPEFDLAQVEIEKFRKELIEYIELMSVELNTKNDALERDGKNLSEIVRKIREQELSDMYRRIQEFQNTAQLQLQQKQTELLQPIYARVDKAIKDVGKENGFIYIFNTSQESSLNYFDESKSTDITALTKAKLKLK